MRHLFHFVGQVDHLFLQHAVGFTQLLILADQYVLIFVIVPSVLCVFIGLSGYFNMLWFLCFNLFYERFLLILSNVRIVLLRYFVHFGNKF